jgi:hypothetical protein
MLVGHQPCSTCRGGHTTWTCLDCGGVVYGPPLSAGCRILVGAAAVRVYRSLDEADATAPGEKTELMTHNAADRVAR